MSRIIVHALTIAVVALACLGPATRSSLAQADAAGPSVSVTPQGGYARILFEWPGEADASATMANDVIVVRFARPIVVDADFIAKRLDGVAALVRLDSDGRAMRIALKTPARIMTSQSGRRFALDVISPQRRGDPPPVEDAAASKAKGPLPVDVRATELETMTRLTFEWPEPVKYDTKLKDGRLTIKFEKPGTADVSRLNAKPPAWVKAITAHSDAANLTLEISVDPEIRLADHVEGGRVIVDLIEPAQDAPLRPAAQQNPNAAANAGPVDAKPAPGPPTSPQASGTPKTLLRTDAAAVAAAAPAPAPVAVPAASNPMSEAGATPPPAQDLAPQDQRPITPPLVPGQLTADISGPNVLVAATFASLPKAAIFRRGPAIWMVFETGDPLNISGLAKVSGTGVSVWSAPQALQPGVLGLRLRADPSTPVSAQIVDQAWVLTIGPGATPDTDGVTFLREVSPGQLSQLKVLAQSAGRTVWVKDPDLGDRLAITVAGAPLRGVLQERRFAEFHVLASLQGVAIRAGADDLQVATAGGALTVSRSRGLSLARDEAPAIDAAAPNPGMAYAAADLASWKRAGEDPRTAPRVLLRASADTPGGMSQQRMALAKYYVANDLGAEALGVMRLIIDQDQTADATPGLRTLRAIANLQMRRYKDAVDDLSLGALARDPHAAFWRGLAFAGLNKAAEARTNLLTAMKYFPSYPSEWQARARLALADASLALGDASEAARALSVTPKDLPKDLAAKYKFAHGRVEEAQAHDDVALSIYAEVMGAGHPETAVRAELQATLLKARAKKLSPDQTIDQLERLRYKWRGDDVELATLHALGMQYVAAGKIRDGLDALSAAVKDFPKSEEAQAIRTDMRKAFADIFLSGKAAAMTPTQALALFYDFKELTPPGLEGDELIRKLTDQLVAADLLPQAADMLQHQVDSRLDGIPRAQVATRLAVIYLLDHKPEKALAAIRASRQTRLPDAMIGERRLLEARALTDLNLTDEAIDVLADDDSSAAGRLRADINWAGQRWAQSAKAAEDLLGQRWMAPDPLNDLERSDVLRAAVAFVLAGDRAGVERLRVRFGTKMADSKDARSFSIVAGEPNPASPDLKAMVRQLASVDSLNEFLNDMKSRSDASLN